MISLGMGVRVVLRQLGPMVQRMQMECDSCDGQGEIINRADRYIEIRDPSLFRFSDVSKIDEMQVEKPRRWRTD